MASWDRGLRRRYEPCGICGSGPTVRNRWVGERVARMMTWVCAEQTADVIGPDGAVVAREGSAISGTCAIAPDFLVAESGGHPPQNQHRHLGAGDSAAPCAMRARGYVPEGDHPHVGTPDVNLREQSVSRARR